MDYAVALAKELKVRNNIVKIGPTMGDVISVTPLKIGIMNNQVYVDDTNCYLCSNVVENYKRKATEEIKGYTVNATTVDSSGDVTSSITVSTKTDYDTVITFKDILHVGDIVLLVPTDDDQKFFIVDKVVL